MSQLNSFNTKYTIKEFNIYLSNQNIKYDLNTYFKEIYNRFYGILDSSLIDYFLYLCNHENEFIIEHQKLQEFGITLADLERLKLFQNKDYLIIESKKRGQLKNYLPAKKEYKLTPYALKLCLITSKNNKMFAKYFIIFEQISHYYQDYLLLCDKNIELNKGLRCAKYTNEQNIKLKEQLKNLEEKYNCLKEKNDNLTEILNCAFQDATLCPAPNVEKKNEKGEFIIL